MTQTFTDNCFIAGGVAQTDMQNIENNFAALKSSFSGTSAPALTLVGGMLWHDSTARKVRNYANTDWLVSLLGDASQKMWVYRNGTCEGWLIDATVTDRVIALKGGSNAYNVSGGALAGTWTVSGHNHSPGTLTVPAHVHQWYKTTFSTLDDEIYNSSGVATTITSNSKQTTDKKISINVQVSGGLPDAYTEVEPATLVTGATGTNSTVITYRPAAAVGTLQYPDLS